MNTWNAHLYLEKFLLRDNWEPTERFLHNKKEWEATQRRLGNCGRSLESEGAPEDQRSWWASLFAFSLHLDSTGGGSIQVLWPTCKAATGHPQRLFQELVPVEKQNVATVDAHRPPPSRAWSSGSNKALRFTHNGPLLHASSRLPHPEKKHTL